MNEKENMILAELRVQYKEGLVCWDSLDHKLIATLLVGFLGAMLIVVRLDIVPWQPFVFVPSVGVVILSLIGLLPQTCQSPIRLDWDALWEDYLSVSDEDAYKQLVSNYLAAFVLNKRRGLRKVWALKSVMFLVGIQALIFIGCCG